MAKDDDLDSQDRRLVENLLTSMDALQARLSKSAEDKLALDEKLKMKLVRKLSMLSKQLNGPSPKRSRNGMKVNRLELSLSIETANFELRVPGTNGSSAMSMDASILDSVSMGAMFGFISSTSYKIISLTLPPGDYSLPEVASNLIQEALTGPDLKKIEARTANPKVWLNLLRGFRKKEQAVYWTMLDYLGNGVDDLLTTEISDVLGQMMLYFDNLKILSIQSRIAKDLVAQKLAWGIRHSKSLERLDLTSTKISNDSIEAILGEAISQNQSLTKVDFPRPPHGDSGDSMTLIRTALPNRQLSFLKLAAFEDLRVFDVAATALRSNRSIGELYVHIARPEDDGTPSGMTEFLDELADNKSFTRISLKKHISLTRTHLQRMWAALQTQNQLNCLELDLHKMPNGWEYDFVSALPTLPIRKIIVNAKGFNWRTVGWRKIVDALQASHDVEHLNLAFHRYNDLDGEDVVLRMQAEHICRLNYCGRRIELLDPHSFNLALWPEVLARINRTGGTGRAGRRLEQLRMGIAIRAAVDDLTPRCRRASLVYEFLHGPLLEVFDP